MELSPKRNRSTSARTYFLNDSGPAMSPSMPTRSMPSRTRAKVGPALTEWFSLRKPGQGRKVKNAMANPAPGFRKRPDHAIRIEPENGRVLVTFAGQVVADSRQALLLHERLCGPQPELTRPSARTTHCPFKGDARYRTLAAGGRIAEDAVWSYPEPFDECADLSGHVAFYADKVGHRSPALTEWCLRKPGLSGRWAAGCRGRPPARRARGLEQRRLAARPGDQLQADGAPVRGEAAGDADRGRGCHRYAHCRPIQST